MSIAKLLWLPAGNLLAFVWRLTSRNLFPQMSEWMVHG
ncbi:hypothetical protein LINGRAHAP2_LOCUS10357 [Linum grandiflorum]